MWTFSCHSKSSEESEVCEWYIRSEFRFFTLLRCVQNDRMSVSYVQNDRIKAYISVLKRLVHQMSAELGDWDGFHGNEISPRFRG